jgi:hypothetical protein
MYRRELASIDKRKKRAESLVASGTRRGAEIGEEYPSEDIFHQWKVWLWQMSVNLATDLPD